MVMNAGSNQEVKSQTYESPTELFPSATMSVSLVPVSGIDKVHP